MLLRPGPSQTSAPTSEWRHFVKPGFVRAGSSLLGAGLAVGTWIALLPWDLSEINARGEVTGTGGDDLFGQVALVGLLVAAVGLGVSLSGRYEVATWMTVGGLASWALLFAWRASVARTAGANLWLLPFIVVVLPAAIAMPLIVWRVGKGRGRRHTARRSNL